MATEDPAETLAGLGEFAVIDRLVAGRDQPAAVALGPGDDAAVVVAGDGKTVVSTDMLVAAGTSGWTGRRRMMSAARPSRRTPPTSRPWVRWPPRSSSRSARPGHADLAGARAGRRDVGGGAAARAPASSVGIWSARRSG